jgi:hypothetical protein
MHAGLPPFISPHVKDAGVAELAQTVVAMDEVAALPIPSCLDWFVVDRRGEQVAGDACRSGLGRLQGAAEIPSHSCASKSRRRALPGFHAGLRS